MCPKATNNKRNPQENNKKRTRKPKGTIGENTWEAILNQWKQRNLPQESQRKTNGKTQNISVKQTERDRDIF